MLGFLLRRRERETGVRTKASARQPAGRQGYEGTRGLFPEPSIDSLRIQPTGELNEELCSPYLPRDIALPDWLAQPSGRTRCVERQLGRHRHRLQGWPPPELQPH